MHALKQDSPSSSAHTVARADALISTRSPVSIIIESELAAARADIDERLKQVGNRIESRIAAMFGFTQSTRIDGATQQASTSRKRQYEPPPRGQRLTRAQVKEMEWAIADTFVPGVRQRPADIMRALRIDRHRFTLRANALVAARILTKHGDGQCTTYELGE